MKLPKNAPEDEEFIKNAHQDPNWPEDLDKPQDWTKVSLPKKIWFKIGNAVIMLTTVTAIMIIVIACHETFLGTEPWMDDERCDQTSNGCSN